VAGEVPSNHVIRDWQETAVRTLGAFDARLLADAGHPLVRARRRVTRLAGLPAFEPTRVDIVAAAEEGSEQRDLFFG